MGNGSETEITFFSLYSLPGLFSLIFLSILGIRDVQLPLSAASAQWLCDCPGRRRHRLWLCHLCPALRRMPGLCGVQTWLHQHPCSPWRGEAISRRERVRQKVISGCRKTKRGKVNSKQEHINIWACEGSLEGGFIKTFVRMSSPPSLWPTDTSLKPLFPHLF